MSDPISNIARAAGYDVATENRLKKAEDAKLAAYDRAKAAEAENRTQADAVELSNVAEQVKASPDIDQAKIDSIKQAIRDGNYPLDPRRIAESFAAFERMI